MLKHLETVADTTKVTIND